MSGESERPETPMPSADEERLLAAYRAASAVLDEAPSADTRAAILAAAARAAGSRPRPVGEPPRWRLPLAAAASVLAGIIALLLATQIEQPPVGDAADGAAEAVSGRLPAATPTVDQQAGQTPAAAPPRIEPPAAGGASDGAAEAVSGRLPAAKPTVGEQAGQTPTAAPPSRIEPPAPAATPAAATGTPQATPSGTGDSGRSASPQPATPAEPPLAPQPVEAFPAAAAPATRAAAAPEPPPGPAAAKSTAAASRPEPAAPPPPGDARGIAPAPAPSAPADARAASEPRGDSAAEPPWRSKVETWIERIVKLRADGRHAEADAELEILRARHPDLRPPASALRPEQR